MSTWWGITSKAAAEGNPLILVLFNRLGFWGTSTMKMLVALVVGSALYAFSGYAVCRWMLYSLAFLYGTFVVYQFILFIGLAHEWVVSLLLTLVVLDTLVTLSLFSRTRKV